MKYCETNLVAEPDIKVLNQSTMDSAQIDDVIIFPNFFVPATYYKDELGKISLDKNNKPMILIPKKFWMFRIIRIDIKARSEESFITFFPAFRDKKVIVQPPDGLRRLKFIDYNNNSGKKIGIFNGTEIILTQGETNVIVGEQQNSQEDQ